MTEKALSSKTRDTSNDDTHFILVKTQGLFFQYHPFPRPDPAGQPLFLYADLSTLHDAVARQIRAVANWCRADTAVRVVQWYGWGCSRSSKRCFVRVVAHVVDEGPDVLEMRLR